MYIITGASGNTGKRIAQILLAANQEVTVVSRNLDHIQDLIALGAKPAVGDLQDVEFMTQVLRGAEAAYLLIPPNFQTTDFRKYQFELGEALAKAVADSQIPNVVLLSSVGAHLTENSGVILGLHHFEQLIKNIPNLNSLAIRAGFFMQNFFGNINLIKNMHIHGGFPVDGDIAFGMIHANDIADFAAQKLQALDFTGASHHNLIGQRELSFKQATQVLGHAIGNPDLPWVTFSYEDAYKGMVGAGLTDSMASLYIEFSKSLNDGFLTSDFKPTNDSLTKTSIEQFSLEFAAAYSKN